MISEQRLEQMQHFTANLRAQRKANGLCVICGKLARANKRECHDCFRSRMQKRDQRKRKAIEYLGGRCADCGYQTDFATVYDFHHKDKSEKTRELDKCILLCANCHRIRHALEDEDVP